MICPACGANLADDLKFCTQCGASLEMAAMADAPVEAFTDAPAAEVAYDTTVLEPESAQTPIFNTEIEPEVFDYVPEEPFVPEKPADKKPMIFGIIALVTGVFSLLLSCCYYTSCFAIPFTITAIVMGILGIVFSKKANDKKAFTLSVVGIVLPVLGIVLAIVSYILMVILGVGGSLLAGITESYYYY